MSDPWTDPGEIAAHFQRLCDGDPVAKSEFVVAVLDPLVNHLRRWRRDADEQACLTAAEDAVMALSNKPTIYDPARCSLIGFLRMSAECDLLNELAKEAKHHRNRESAESVELVPDDGNTSEEELADNLPSFNDPNIVAEIASFTPTERAVFDLMRDGVKATAAFAAALGIGELPSGEQEREVKRVKDRIKKRLQRAGRKT